MSYTMPFGTVSGRHNPVVTVEVQSAAPPYVILRLDYEKKLELWTEIRLTQSQLGVFRDTLQKETGTLTWTKSEDYPHLQEAHIGPEKDGVLFALEYVPTCYRRGQWKLLIEVEHGPSHHKWGCFDEQDQPLRYFHSETNAKEEAELIATVLLRDRIKID